MLSLKLLREQPQFVIDRLAIKNFNATEIVAQINILDKKRISLQIELDNLLSVQNTMAKEIGLLMKTGKRDEAESKKAGVADLKNKSREIEDKMQSSIEELNAALVQLPNLPYESVPTGKHAEDNIVIREGCTIPHLKENAQPHWDLLNKLDIIDFDLGVKITGAGFPVYKGKGARLQRALIDFFLDRNTKGGYTEYMLPLLVNEASAFGTCNLPDKEGQMYHITEDNFYLIPTAEIPATNVFRDVILNANEIPAKLTGYTPCFRREAGSYGKDVRGLNRLHQFDKVEIVQVTRPEDSYEALEQMVKHVESIIQSLELPYRILRLCGGDMSFASAITYDFEVYSAGQKRWLEVSSVSNFESYQANRLKLRYRDQNGKTQLAHTLNGSSLALPRMLAAILENYQDNGKIHIPKVLQEYTGFTVID